MTKLINKAKKKKKTVRMKFIYCCYNANTDLFKVPLIGDTCDDHENQELLLHKKQIYPKYSPQ